MMIMVVMVPITSLLTREFLREVPRRHVISGGILQYAWRRGWCVTRSRVARSSFVFAWRVTSRGFSTDAGVRLNERRHSSYATFLSPIHCLFTSCRFTISLHVPLLETDYRPSLGDMLTCYHLAVQKLPSSYIKCYIVYTLPKFASIITSHLLTLVLAENSLSGNLIDYHTHPHRFSFQLF